MAEFIKLLICLFAAPIMSTIIVVAFRYPRLKLPSTEEIRLTFKLVPEKGLMEQGLLWLSILTPITYFIVIGLFAWMPYNLEISQHGFNGFISISKLPLAILSLVLPLPVLVSRFHATEQTAKQIQVAKHKNSLDAFYSHRKAMFDYFDQIEIPEFEGGIQGEFRVSPRLHLDAFKGSTPEKGMPERYDPFFEEVERELRKAEEFVCQALRYIDFGEQFGRYKEACNSLRKVSDLLSLTSLDYSMHKDSHAINHRPNGQAWEPLLLTIGDSTDRLVGAFRYCREAYRILCDFAGFDPVIVDPQDPDLVITWSLNDEVQSYKANGLEPIETLLRAIPHNGLRMAKVKIMKKRRRL